MWEKSKDEEAFYARMFQLADVDKTGKVEGKRAVEFFTKSGLPATILKQVWSLASTNMQPYLNQDEFNVALGLIALAQRGDPLELARLDALGKSHLLPLPVLHTISGVAMSKDFVMAASDEAKYKTLFRDAVGGDITISVAAAMDLFQKSGLSLPELHDIYRLVDHGRSTSTPLPVTSFTIAMHLIVCKTRRGMSVLPTSIPMELFPTLELPPIALDHVSSGQSPAAMLELQLGAQNKLVEALARVPIPSSSPQSTLDIHLDAVEALGYVLPSRHTTAIADGAALSELESVLLRYIAQVTQELLELQDSKPTSAVVPVQTLLQTLANLKQQSTRLVEQKEAALRRLHPPTLHIDTNQDGVGRPSCFDSTFDHDAAPTTSTTSTFQTTTTTSTPQVDFFASRAEMAGAAAPTFAVPMDGAGLFSPSLDKHSFDGSSGGGASAAGTGGSTSNTQPPNHASYFGPPTTQTSVAVLDAFASATTTNTISFDALDAMNDMDLSVGDKYYTVGLSEGGLDDDKAAAAASSSSSFPPTTTPARSTSDLKQSVVDTSRPISRKASIAAAAVPPPPLVAPPTNSSPGFATEFAAAFPPPATTTPSFATLFDDQQQPTSGAPFDPPPASSSFFAAFGDFDDTTSSSFEAAFDTPTTTIAAAPGFGGDSLSGAAAASSGDQPRPPPSSSPSCSALFNNDTTISSDDTFGQFEASFEAFGINNADATASWNTAVADTDGFSSWFPSDSTTTTSSSSRAPRTDDGFDPSFGHFTTSATSCDDSVADRSTTSNDDPIGGGIGGGGFENDVTGFAANVTETAAGVQDTNDPQANCSSSMTGTASHTSQPHKDDHISATTRRISDQGSSSQGGEAGDTATAFQSDQGDADLAALDWSFQAAALPSLVSDDGTNHHMSNSSIGQGQGQSLPIDQDTALNGGAVTSFHDEAVKTEPTVSQIASPPPLPSHQDADSVAVDGCGCLFGLPHDDPTDDDKMPHPSASPSNDVGTPSDEMPRLDRADAEDSVGFPADMSTPSSPPATETTPTDLVSETSFNALLPPQSAAASATTSAIDDIFGDFTFSPAALGDRRVASDPFLTTFASNAAAFPTSYATEPADASSDNMFADFADFQSSVGTSTWDFPATTFPPSTATPSDDFTF